MKSVRIGYGNQFSPQSQDETLIYFLMIQLHLSLKTAVSGAELRKEVIKEDDFFCTQRRKHPAEISGNSTGPTGNEDSRILVKF